MIAAAVALLSLAVPTADPLPKKTPEAEALARQRGEIIDPPEKKNRRSPKGETSETEESLLEWAESSVSGDQAKLCGLMAAVLRASMRITRQGCDPKTEGRLVAAARKVVAAYECLPADKVYDDHDSVFRTYLTMSRKTKSFRDGVPELRRPG